MVWEVLVGASDRLATVQILSLEVRPVGREDKSRLRLGSGGLSFNAARVFVTSPGLQVTMWILFV